MKERALKQSWLLAFAGAVAAFCAYVGYDRLAAARYDDNYYATVVPVTLLGADSANESGLPATNQHSVQGWQLHVRNGYLMGDSRPTQLLGLVFLYPSMDFFRPSIRQAWFKKSPGEKWGPTVKVFLGNEARVAKLGDAALRSIQAQIGRTYLPADPPARLMQVIPTIRAYRDVRADSRSAEDRLSYVFTQSDGRTVVTECYLNCVAQSSWRGDLAVEYQFSVSRMFEMVDVDNAVDHLISTLNPTPIQNLE
jgi:hypothetical protein